MRRSVGAALSAAAIATALVGGLGCAPSREPRAAFEYALPEFSTRLAGASFEYVKLGATARVPIPERRDAMKRTLEIGLVNEALRQLHAQAPPGEATGFVNVVVVVTEMTTTREALFTSTSTTRRDLELVVRADIVRFVPRPGAAPSATPAPAAAPPTPPPRAAQGEP